MEALNSGLMYRLVRTESGVTSINQLRAQLIGRVRLRLDGRGHYAVIAGGGTGGSFQGSWNDTGIGTGSPVQGMYVKQFYLSAAPTKSVEAQAGGLYIQRGEATEITSFDNDGYIVGARVAVKSKRAWRPADAALSVGYLDASLAPNVFRRFDGPLTGNYVQALATWRLKSVAATGDWTELDGNGVARMALSAKPSGGIVRSVRAEAYRRADHSEAGFALSAERAVLKASVTAGYADIGKSCGRLNADRFPSGRRVFTVATIPIRNGITLTAFGGRLVGEPQRALGPRTRFDVVLGYNMLTLVH